MFIRFALFICLLSLSNVVQAEDVKSSKPIKIILNDWSSQLVLAHITGNIFQEVGYNVLYRHSTTADQWGLLRYGFADVQVEIWEGTMANMYKRFIEHERDSIVDAGTHSATTREEWWYPSFVEDLCPQLPDWKALQKCSEIFATQETTPRGRYLAGPWEKPDLARIRALKLNFNKVQVGSVNELWAALNYAVKHKEPIVLFNWTPNWVEAKFDGKFVEFPSWEEECESVPEWGINTVFLHDCGNPTNGWLKKVGSPKMETTWPCAFETLKNIDFNNAMLSELAAMVDVDGKTPKRAADSWLNHNLSLWNSWIPKNCR